MNTAVMAAFIAAAVAVALFVARELATERLERRRAASALAVYADAVGRELERNDLAAVPAIEVRDVLESAWGVLELREAAVLAAKIEEVLYELGVARRRGEPVERAKRQKLAAELQTLAQSHRAKAGIGQHVGWGLPWMRRRP